MSDLKKNSKTNKIKKTLTKNYSSVRSQKGRVDTDEDWEELDPVEPEITIKKSSNGNHDDPYPVEAAIHAEHPPMDIPMQAMAHTEPPPMDIPMQAVAHVEPPSVRDIPLQSVGHKEPFIPEDLTSEAFRINSFKAESKESGKENLSESDNASLGDVVKILAQASSVIFFTGAGISAPSVQFPNSGLINLAVKTAIRERNYYKILNTNHGEMFRNAYLFGSLLPILNASPNQGHFALVQIGQILELLPQKSIIITQNLDKLHEAARPSSTIIHIHGSIFRGRCSHCDRKVDYHHILQNYQKHPTSHELFLCRSHNAGNCPGEISPDMVEYGEEVRGYDKCAELAKTSDVILVIGTSLRVSPANQLVDLVKNGGGKVILYTRSETLKDSLADVHIRGDLQLVLPQTKRLLQKYILDEKNLPRKVKRKIKRV